MKSLCEVFGIWKLKTKIWNLFVKCLEGIWKFKNWNIWMLKTENEMSKYWKLKIEMSEYWKLKTKMFEYWELKC